MALQGEPPRDPRSRAVTGIINVRSGAVAMELE